MHPVSIVSYHYTNNFSFVTVTLPQKTTSPQTSEPCPRWEDSQGVTAAATDARAGQNCHSSGNPVREAREKGDWDKRYITQGGRAWAFAGFISILLAWRIGVFLITL